MLPSQIREQICGADLHVFKLKFLALNNWVFPHKKYFSNFFWLLFSFNLCNFSVRTLKYFQKILNEFFVDKNFRKRASKVAYNRPRPFLFHSPAQTTAHQAWIFLFRNCTIPNHNPEMRLLFQKIFIIILVTKSHDK